MCVFVCWLYNCWYFVGSYGKVLRTYVCVITLIVLRCNILPGGTPRKGGKIDSKKQV